MGNQIWIVCLLRWNEKSYLTGSISWLVKWYSIFFIRTFTVVLITISTFHHAILLLIWQHIFLSSNHGADNPFYKWLFVLIIIIFFLVILYQSHISRVRKKKNLVSPVTKSTERTSIETVLLVSFLIKPTVYVVM